MATVAETLEMAASRQLQLLIADCRQGLFDAAKADAGASTALRIEVSYAFELLGKISDALDDAASEARGQQS